MIRKMELLNILEILHIIIQIRINSKRALNQGNKIKRYIVI